MLHIYYYKNIRFLSKLINLVLKNDLLIFKSFYLIIARILGMFFLNYHVKNKNIENYALLFTANYKQNCY